MKKKLILALSTMLVFALLPAGAHAGHEEDDVPCDPAPGREVLTPDGFELDFAPAAPISDLGAVREATGGALTPLRNAHFAFQAILGEAHRADMSFELTWADPTNDYDLHVYDADGFLVGVSQDENPTTGVAREHVALNFGDCDVFTVIARNWAGSPVTETLTLAITVEPDVDPGELPLPPTYLYLAGDPGQASMASDTAGSGDVAAPALTAERPTDNEPNQYTRPVVGFRDQYKNPFLGWWSMFPEEPITVSGNVSALVWVSSATMNNADLGEAVLYVDLYLNGGLASSVQVPGAQIGETPTPLYVDFGDHDVLLDWEVGIQVGSEPAVSSTGPLDDPADAHQTTWYHSVQFPSMVVLHQ